MLNKKLKVILLTISFVILFFFLWQYYLANKLTANQISCEGDFSYNIKCPIGTHCVTLDKKTPLAGGWCKTYLFANPTRMPNYETDCGCDLGSVVSDNCRFNKEPTCISKFVCECQ